VADVADDDGPEIPARRHPHGCHGDPGPELSAAGVPRHVPCTGRPI